MSSLLSIGPRAKADAAGNATQILVTPQDAKTATIVVLAGNACSKLGQVTEISATRIGGLASCTGEVMSLPILMTTGSHEILDRCAGGTTRKKKTCSKLCCMSCRYNGYTKVDLNCPQSLTVIAIVLSRQKVRRKPSRHLSLSLHLGCCEIHLCSTFQSSFNSMGES